MSTSAEPGLPLCKRLEAGALPKSGMWQSNDWGGHIELLADNLWLVQQALHGEQALPAMQLGDVHLLVRFEVHASGGAWGL